MARLAPCRRIVGPCTGLEFFWIGPGLGDQRVVKFLADLGIGRGQVFQLARIFPQMLELLFGSIIAIYFSMIHILVGAFSNH